jgi:hypothetical protein
MTNNRIDNSFKTYSDPLFASEVKALSDTFRSKHRADIAQMASHVLLSTQLMLSFGKANGIDMKVHLAIQNVLVGNWLVNAEIEPADFKAALGDLGKASQTASILSSLPD